MLSNQRLRDLKYKIYKDDKFNIYSSIAQWQRITKLYNIDPNILIPVLEYYIKHKKNIRNRWGWFQRVFSDAWFQYNANKNIEESELWKTSKPTPQMSDLIRRTGK